MMLGRVPAPVPAQHNRGCAFFKGLSKEIDSADCQGDGVENPLAAPALAVVLDYIYFMHHVSRILAGE
jgi:hypothetical protein